MNERKKSIDELLSDLGVLEEAPVEVELKESGTPEAQGDPRAFLEEFLGGLLLLLDPGHRLEVRVEGETLKAEVKGGDLSRFIGKEGRTLRAVEHLARVAHQELQQREFLRCEFNALAFADRFVPAKVQLQASHAQRQLLTRRTGGTSRQCTHPC